MCPHVFPGCPAFIQAHRAIAAEPEWSRAWGAWQKANGFWWSFVLLSICCFECCCKEGIKNEKQRYWQHQSRLPLWQLSAGPGVHKITVGPSRRGGMEGGREWHGSYWVDLQLYLPGLGLSCLQGRLWTGSLHGQTLQVPPRYTI